MTQLQLPDELAAELQDLAIRDHQSVEFVMREAITNYLSLRAFEPELSPVQLEGLQHSLAQAERGDLIPQEEVDAFFDNWKKETPSQ